MYEQTPILRALQRHVQIARGSLHVPGHQQGAVLPQQFGIWMSHAAKLDLTELPGLDNLMAPEECILESERLAASHYGSERCFYSVNGSSAGIMAALVALLQSGDTVLFVNPFHLSAWNGLVHSGGSLVCMDFEFSNEGRQRLPAASQVQEALVNHPNVQAVFLTSPTYHGDTADVKAIARVVHDFDLPLIVDEAHGAHFGLVPEFPQHSVAAGADVVIQSTHKMLPALTQTAWIHIQGGRVNQSQFAAALNSLQTSSPSYLLMASLDAVQAWLRTEGKDAAARTVLRLQKYGLLEGQEEGGVYRDPLKHWVPADGEQSRILQNMLSRRGLFVEYADEAGLLSVLPLDLRESVLSQYVQTLKEWESKRPAAEGMRDQPIRTGIDDLNTLAAVSPRNFAIRPRDAERIGRRRIPLGQAAGAVAAVPLAPYPPGVPVIYPGQEITAELIHILSRWVKAGQKIHGVTVNGEIDILS